MTDAYIPAATILLLRDAPALQVLMVERHVDIAFAGGALVFPGGRIDGGDHDPGWDIYCDGIGTIAPEQKAPRIAAVREAFEETGVLLAKRDGKVVDDSVIQGLAPMRSVIEQDDTKFLPMVKAEGLRLALDELHLFARWRPPKTVPHRRYDTWFFAARAPVRQTAQPDGGEATEVLWTHPADALSDCKAGKRKMIFPTSRNVELLGVSDKTASVFAMAQARKIRAVVPAVVEREDGVFLTIPDDLGYPITEEPIKQALRS